MMPRRRAESHLFGSMINIGIVIKRNTVRRYPRLSRKKVSMVKNTRIRRTFLYFDPKGRRCSCSLTRQEQIRKIIERRIKIIPSPKGNAPGPSSDSVPILYLEEKKVIIIPIQSQIRP
jgi:hypothetical protein